MIESLDESGKKTHGLIGVLAFQFLNDVEISLLRGGHIGMAEPASHTRNRDASEE